MSKKSMFGKNTTAATLLFFAVALVLIGIVLRSRIGTLLESYTERQTEMQVRAYALVIREKLFTELENLKYVSSILERSIDDVDDLMPRIYVEPGISQGLIDIDGEAPYGNKMNVTVYSGIRASFRGETAITYVQDEGLLFTCPVFHDKNIRYVLYRLCPFDMIESYFATEIYDDQGKLCVMTREGRIVVPFYNSNDKDVEWFNSEDVGRKYESMNMEMEVSIAVARNFETDRGEMILFKGEVPETDFLVVGFVPKAVASSGIGNITLLVVWVFGLLMLLVIMGAVYLTRVSVKARESDELRKAKAMAEHASKAKSDFLASMSHEIRTPINAVLGMNEMILRESGEEEIVAYAQNVAKAGDSLLDIVNDILDVSKIEAGRMEIVEVDYNLTSMINDLVNMVQIRADEKDLQLFRTFDAEMPTMLHGDEVRIKQVISNILTNAVKYTEKGSVTFSMGYERAEDDPNAVFLLVSVKDTGIGIKDEDRDRLFLKFERLESEQNRHIEGTGLGMNITLRLLRMMGSRLQLESAYGEGSNFHFRLRQTVVKWEPLGDYEAAYKASMQSRKHYKEKFTAPTARVLVIDDNPMNLVVFKSLLKKTDLVIDTANDGDTGLALAFETKYDAIFIDHMMPGKDGIETLRELERTKGHPNRETPKVCLTANAIAGAREEYIEAGFDGYLSKPIDPERLEDMLILYLPEEKVRREEVAEEEEAEEDVEVPEALAPLEGSGLIDVRRGIKNSGTVDAYVELLELFYTSIETRRDEIEGFFNEGDFENYVIKVHALKSSARIIGAIDFGEEAQAIEDAGKGGRYDEVRNRHAAFIEEYGKFTEPFGEALSNLRGPKKETPLVKASFLTACYGEIRDAAESMDLDRLDEVFEKMEEFSLPPEEVAFWDELRDAYEQLDYDRLGELMDTKE